MDEKVEQRSPQKIKENNMNFKLKIPDINLNELKKQTHLLASPRAQRAVTKSSSTRWNCLCSPTTHAGSFRCRHHRSSCMLRGGSVGSNLSELARKPGAISDSLEAQ
ncbi:hypothetical protein L484_020205 [Morus notabilis]|uniref:Uncharacterized protein n=1 Tax=Morus notabilis TaxID=981085 RepID=W9SBP1_9ROSA|nr:uncharacterized protein LOC21403113 [Morus notabilis]EXB97656.1 hypothetical protein L484_020205 [Morus notabilis]